MNSNNPKQHCMNMRKRLQDNVDHLRADILKIEDAQFKALFETSAEVLLGIIKAMEDYEQKKEPAWQNQSKA